MADLFPKRTIILLEAKASTAGVVKVRDSDLRVVDCIRYCDGVISFCDGSFEMVFGLTEEQEALRKEIRAFATKEVLPHVMEWDEKSEFPHDVVKKMGKMGLMGVIFPSPVKITFPFA